MCVGGECGRAHTTLAPELAACQPSLTHHANVTGRTTHADASCVGAVDDRQQLLVERRQLAPAWQVAFAYHARLSVYGCISTHHGHQSANSCGRWGSGGGGGVRGAHAQCTRCLLSGRNSHLHLQRPWPACAAAAGDGAASGGRRRALGLDTTRSHVSGPQLGHSLIYSVRPRCTRCAV